MDKKVILWGNSSKKIAPDSESKGVVKSKEIIQSSSPYVKAIAKKKGIVILETAHGFEVTRWGKVRTCSDFNDVLFFLRKMGEKI